MVCVINFIGGRYFTVCTELLFLSCAPHLMSTPPNSSKCKQSTSKMILILLCASSTPILGCRFVLNLQEAYYRPFRDECQQDRMTTILPIAFASNSGGQ